MAETKDGQSEATQAGNYFISNYPPYSFWKPELVESALEALDRLPRTGTPLGQYVHIPFCRKRCHFCYFKVYTRQRSSEIQEYLDAAIAELDLHLQHEFVGGRKPQFVYLGGGTPSYLSTDQLGGFVKKLQERLPWDESQEITMECEPGTLTEKKLAVMRRLGVTRLSLGVENFDDRVLALNGRAHGSREIHQAWEWIQAQRFPQVNIDLIAGMLDESDENWRRCVERTVTMGPESVTVYQMEVPFNTTIFQSMKEEGRLTAPVADWPTKRRWVDHAFRELEKAGYRVVSSYTAVRRDTEAFFVYRDALWRGADLLSIGVSSFGHINGTHLQNEQNLKRYMERVQAGELPIYRALSPNRKELMIRELILQFKLGHIRPAYFEKKFGVDIQGEFANQFGELRQKGHLLAGDEELVLSRDALLQVDALLPAFFLHRHRHARYF